MTGHRGDPAAESIEGPFLSVARRYSLCDDDAWEALARGFQIAMRHRERIRPDTAAAWFATVVRHEAMHPPKPQPRRAPRPGGPRTASPEPEPEREPDPRLPALRDAMRQLKPDERRALIMFYAMEPGHRDGGRYRRIAGLSRGVHVNVAVRLGADVDDMSSTTPSLAFIPGNSVADAKALSLLPRCDSAAARARCLTALLLLAHSASGLLREELGYACLRAYAGSLPGQRRRAFACRPRQSSRRRRPR